jgi:predicted nucleic acid-binding protein
MPAANAPGLVVIDTNVASGLLRRTLAGSLAARLARPPLAVTFVTVGELTKWADVYDWGRRRHADLDARLGRWTELGYDTAVARTWGRLAAAGVRRGRTPQVNDLWIAACCLVEGLPLATFNLKDFADAAAHHGLELVDVD